MIAELTAARDVLEVAVQALDAAATAGIGDMTGALPPFVSVYGPPGARPQDEAVGGPDGDEFSARMGCTFTAARADAALLMAEAGIQALTPNRRPGRLSVAGRVVWVEFVEARDVLTDYDVTLTGTNTHPAYVVVRFQIHSTPEAS